MDKQKILSGHDLVAKGLNKTEAALPEVGVKQVTPNGSWLEQKQIQAAIEARKHLVEVERIEKVGSLSHAIWREDLKLAEVVKNVGGHWHFMGHNVGKHLYLKPEEALYLLEINCLILKHNEVIVSLQKAYSLLLDSNISLIQYKVYASLSRLGYKVIRHRKSNLPDTIVIKEEKLEEDKEFGTAKGTLSIEYVDKTNRLSSATDNKDENNTSSIENVDKTNGLSSATDNKDENNTSSIENVDKSNGLSSATDNRDENNTSSIENVDKSNGLSSATDNRDENNTSSIENVDKSNGLSSATDNKDENNTSSIENADITNGLSSATDNKDENNTSSIENVDKCNEENGATDKNDNESQDVKMEVDNVEIKVEQLNDFEDLTGNKNTSIDNVVEPKAENENTSIKNDVESSGLINNATDQNTVENNELQITKMEVDNNANEKVFIVNDGDVKMEVVEDREGDFRDNTKSTNSENTAQFSVDENGVTRILKDIDFVETAQINRYVKNQIITKKKESKPIIQKTFSEIYQIKLQKLRSRKLKCLDSNICDAFNNIPDTYRKQVVTFNTPDEKYLPRNVFLNNSSYVLNIDCIKSKMSVSPVLSIEDNPNARRIGPPSDSEPTNRAHFTANPQFSPQYQQSHFPRYTHQHHFRPYTHWRPRQPYNFNFGYFNYPVMFPRHYLPQYFIPPPRCRPQQSPPTPLPLAPASHYDWRTSFEPSYQNYRRRRYTGRKRDVKLYHYEQIKTLASKLKQLSALSQPINTNSLYKLIFAYNSKYNENLRITYNFEIEDANDVIINLDDEEEEESSDTNPSLGAYNSLYDKHFENLKKVAIRLKEMELKNQCASRHRRALSHLIKTFNKSFKVEVYLDDNYDIIDRKLVKLDSSSDSDVAPVKKESLKRKKKLRNPFNILKRLREESKSENASTSMSEPEVIDDDNEIKVKEIKLNLSKHFDKKWLPDDNDFGRAEICDINAAKTRVLESREEEFLYDYLKHHTFNNWLELKISFVSHLEATALVCQQTDILSKDYVMEIEKVRPILGPEDDCTNTESVLSKLRIIQTNKYIPDNTSLRLDFDVYNRNVQNFRKSNPPKPHFRIICIDESSSFPDALEVASLNAAYDDNVPIAFAVVGIGSISYLQINSTDIPIYIPNKE